MATILKGILGGFKGLVGTVIGSSHRDQEVMRSRPKKSSKPPVQTQVDQRLKFGLMTDFLGNFSALIKKAFKPANQRESPMNSAVSYNLLNAIKGISPDFSIDYSMITISNGELYNANNIVVTPLADAEVKIDWAPITASDENKEIMDQDKVMLVFYSTGQKRYMVFTANAVRGAGTVTVELARSFAASPVHGYLYFLSPSGKDSSRTDYLGTIQLIL